ncbi:GNAT family N-acetyltransferase [Stigmatella aurantiaca]|uniref:Acetyltransferase, GNAT family n=1 Tax=Stigmatella aurantiaca (strain DW4/3-1) TaxID=378806 RepID=Q08SC7_STIAD|nr:GNAT family N-acetyltransferase [Stigmatella aurantiaca]ADO70711.1 Acetyltransferase, GNAT family [Stigmatella aurantiaca DW4/3-1]EAU63401.1 ElaA protein [Stigmatella aurantiaca DW4/3-1]
MLSWQWKTFSELTLDELYRLLALRSEVFVLEQKSLYLDLDGLDRACHHLLGQHAGQAGPALAAYLRILPPGLKYPEASFGRVVTSSAMRGQGHGKLLVEKGLAFIESAYASPPIRIGAQHHLQRFYEGYGFRQVSEVYDEDGIPHIDMLRAPSSRSL